MNWREIRSNGHWPTLATSFLYFDVSFMVWTILGALGSLIAPALGLNAQQKFLMVSTPILAGAFLRIVLSLLVDRIGMKTTGIGAQVVVMIGLAIAWQAGLSSLNQALLLGLVLGLAGASFAVALPQSGRWYPPHMQGVVLGLAGAGNVGVVIDHLLAPRIAAVWGWQAVFGAALLPLMLAFVLYVIFSKEPPGQFKKKKLSDYLSLLRERDAHWFCFFYTISFGGFVGLATAFAIYFRDEFGLGAVHAGEIAAFCTLVGALGRPTGGALADRLGGIRALGMFFSIALLALVAAAFSHNLWACGAAFFVASGAFGMCNGSVFQLLPQRFAKDISVMTGLVGCGGGIGGFILGMLFGASKEHTGSYVTGILLFAGLSLAALAGLYLVKKRWRTTWGATAQARI
ncbi:MAG: transporter, family, nitrate/nitrite transporter [Verrucomicrobiota bacterium]|nr:transporter, family, nitrate/nitrite transporter [Verrucomicrobiota bacterium]